jgi:hypothetical protein
MADVAPGELVEIDFGRLGLVLPRSLQRSAALPD